MGDKDKKKDQAEGGKNIKENKTVSTLNDTLEKVFRDVALIDPKENVEGVIKESARDEDRAYGRRDGATCFREYAAEVA